MQSKSLEIPHPHGQTVFSNAIKNPTFPDLVPGRGGRWGGGGGRRVGISIEKCIKRVGMFFSSNKNKLELAQSDNLKGYIQW